MQKENRYLLDSDNENPGFHKMTTLKNNKVLDNDVRWMSLSGKLEIQKEEIREETKDLQNF